MLERLNMRERFFAQMEKNPDVAVPNWEFSYWDTTLSGWHGQGLPATIKSPMEAYAYFGIEGFHFADGFYIPGGNLRLCPGLEPKFLGVDGGQEIHIDSDGVKFAKFTEGQNSIPHYLDYPVKGRREWEEIYKPRLDADDSRRWPETDWKAVMRRFEDSGPSCLHSMLWPT